MKKYFLFLALATFSFASLSWACGPKPKSWTLKEGLEQPESALFDPLTTHIFVSNVAGDSGTKDGKGWISRLNQDGVMLSAQWISGLNAPKGMAVSGDDLWVSDIDRLIHISISQSRIVEKISFKDAKFLNDVTLDRATGTIFVSDTLASRIYSVNKDKKVNVVFEGPEAESPNGLWVDGNTLYVAAWGFVKDFAESAQAQGNFYSLDLTSKKKTVLSKKPLGNLDGLWTTDPKNGFYVSDWIKGQVFFVTRKGWVDNNLKAFKPFKKDGIPGSADFGFVTKDYGSMLLVPSMQSNALHGITL